MNVRAFLIALACAGFSVVLLLAYLHRFEEEVSGGERVELLVAVKAVARGEAIQDDMLTTRSVPLAYVEERAIKASERTRIVGIPAAFALAPQQTLLWTDLSVVTEDRSLSSLVQPGRRAVTVRATGSSDDSAGNVLIRPGDYVDVIITSDGSGDTHESTSGVLLQRVLVLAVGRETRVGNADTKQDDHNAIESKPLTLSLTLEESQLISLAIERGKLSVAVRNPDDPALQNDIPDIKASALLEVKARVQTRARARSNSAGPVRIEEARLP